ncbi:MAG: hypothetical protein ACLFO1_06580 [Spirochaetaceae bacterium]
MIHVITDSEELLEALTREMSLLRDEAAAPGRVFSGDDLCAYLVSHTGQRAVAQFAFLLGRERAASAPDPQPRADETPGPSRLVLAFAAPSRQHPALIEELSRGKERYRAELDPDLDLPRVTARVLPEDIDIDPDSAAADLHEAQRRFIGAGTDTATVSLLMWWLIGAAQCFLAHDQIVPMLTPRPDGRGLRESVAAVRTVVERARGATARRRGEDGPARRDRSPRAEEAPQ